MQIELTKEQYRELVKVVYLGSWMINSFRNAEERVDAAEAIEQYINSYAKQFESEDLVVYNAKYNVHDVSRELEGQLHQFIDEYDEDTFWAELAERLALRDIARKAGPVLQLTDHQVEEQYEIEEQYFKEFEKNGLKNVFIKVK